MERSYRDIRDVVLNGSYKELIKDRQFVTDNFKMLLIVGSTHGVPDIIRAIDGVAPIGTEAFPDACAKGHAETARLIYNILETQENPLPHFMNGISAMIRNMNFELVNEFLPEIRNLDQGNKDCILRQLVYKNYVAWLEIFHTIIDIKSQNFIQMACMFGARHALEFLVDKCGIEIPVDLKNTATDSAVLFKDFDMAYFLVKRGLSFYSRGPEDLDIITKIKRYCEIRDQSAERAKMELIKRVYYNWIQLIYTPGSESAKRLAAASFEASARGEIL